MGKRKRSRRRSCLTWKWQIKRRNSRKIHGTYSREQRSEIEWNGGDIGWKFGAGGVSLVSAFKSSILEDEWPLEKAQETHGYKSTRKAHFRELFKALPHDSNRVSGSSTLHSWKFSENLKKDLREWLGLCEDHFTLRSRTLTTEKFKVPCARLQTKEGSVAMTFEGDYVHRMKDGQHSFEEWKVFNREMCRRFLTTQEGSETLYKMQQIYHNGDISQ